MKPQKKKQNARYQPRLRRVFSTEFKRTRVREIESGIVTIGEIVRAYKVSDVAVRKWMTRFSSIIQPGQCVVVQLESEAAKTIALQKRTEELERIIGQKQLQLDYYEQLIQTASCELNVDIKKNSAGLSSPGFPDTARKVVGS